MNSINYSEAATELTLAYGVGELAGRFVGGALGKISKFSHTYIFACGLTFAGIISMLTKRFSQIQFIYFYVIGE